MAPIEFLAVLSGLGIISMSSLPETAASLCSCWTWLVRKTRQYDVAVSDMGDWEPEVDVREGTIEQIFNKSIRYSTIPSSQVSNSLYAPWKRRSSPRNFPIGLDIAVAILELA